MRVIETGLQGCVVIEPRVFEDDRGYFFEAFNLDKLQPHGIKPLFVQGNLSRSRRGVLRGLHYQWPGPQGKYVSVVEGEVWDVAVDVRRGSPTFGRWTAAVLSAGNKRHLWIAEGYAHGFVVLSEHAVLSYLCTAPYNAAADAAIRWDDPDLAIDWPIASPDLSQKDAAAPFLRDIEPGRLPTLLP